MSFGVNDGVFGGFEYESEIEEIVIPEGVYRIDNEVFYNCSRLKKITLPDSLREVGYYAFYGCKSLTAVHFPAGMQFISGDAFCGCEKLTELTIPESVYHIGGGAFSGCKQLSVIRLHPDDPAIPVGYSEISALEQKVLWILDMFRTGDYEDRYYYQMDYRAKFSLLSLHYLHTHDAALGAYIRSELEDFMEILLPAGVAEPIAAFAAGGLFTKAETEYYMNMAQETGQNEIFMILLKSKNEHFGFDDTKKLKL